ncbi:hypothetical protein [Elongatibacter sediminis]|uniref:Type II secretion system protein GspC N-terminal domain-containing protein n=1 Tax=Elongatibacter sediminis TaxID=3119006 RepID=A0AAW9RGW9_9GAMM
MMRWLQDNPIGLGLAVVCGVLVLSMAGLGVVSLLPAYRGGDADNAAPDAQALQLPELAESAPIDEYYVITERPLFNESRQPVLEDELSVDPLAEEMVEDDPDAPDVELSGVVITPSLRMATLRTKDEGRSLVAFEGRPIEESDFGSWQVSRVDAREVMLTSAAGEELRLELKVHDEQITPPAAPVSRPQGSRQDEAPEGRVQQTRQQESGEADADGKPLSRAEEIRRRIAERREELRRQAEQQEQPSEEEAAPDYQRAIQSMIGRSRRDGDNQNEQ